eukprot:5129720-Pleurochrysis_carterae.AAC.1
MIEKKAAEHRVESLGDGRGEARREVRIVGRWAQGVHTSNSRALFGPVAGFWQACMRNPLLVSANTHEYCRSFRQACTAKELERTCSAPVCPSFHSTSARLRAWLLLPLLRSAGRCGGVVVARRGVALALAFVRARAKSAS